MIRRPPRSTLSSSSAASDVYKRQEFLCLLPLTIPALVIVVGLRNVYLWVTYFLGESALTLTFVYVVLVLPFAYRAIDAALSAIDLQTLAEAARSLGAGL